MASEDLPLWMTRRWLREVQYRTDANLAARQSIYAYQRPRLDLPGVVLGLAQLTGTETVTDVGCGNGGYLAELARRGHAGPVLGVDLSAGMLAAARARAPAAGLAAGDATALPVRDAASDLTLAMHMLYHVPEQSAAITELRRITRPGGQVLVGLNGEDHVCELRQLVAEVLADIGPADLPAEPLIRDRLRLDQGEQLLARVFPSVTRHDFTGELLLPRQPAEDYVRSLAISHRLPQPERLVAAVGTRIAAGRDGAFKVRTHTGCLICS
jgi:SAM-dependent methyltransferase